MGNNGSHQRTKVPKQACKERPPDLDKAQRKQQFINHLKWKKPSQRPWAGASVGEGPSIKAGRTKIMLLFPLDKRQQLAEARGSPGARTALLDEDGVSAPADPQTEPPMLRGAGDGAERRESVHAREMKILVLLLLLDARLQEEGHRAMGGPGAGRGAKAAQRWQRLYSRLLTEGQADRNADPVEAQPRKRCRCPRPRP
uniref:Bcl-2-like protein from testis n=1 Tax=Catagonus wagneri TaxID=51154 RepID=A0A8C3WBS5_9CETA